MTDLIDRIGPYVGVAAFVGLALLAFLVIQQAREVRRLREWAGRAPERARDAAEAETALADAKGEAAPEQVVEEPDPTRFGLWWQGVRDSVAGFGAEIDRRSPVHPRYILAVLAAGVVAAAVLTSGFGIFGGDDASSGGGGKAEKPPKVEVAVLNATQVEDTVTGEPIAAVPGLAGLVSKKVVKSEDFKIAVKDDAPAGLEETVIMFEPGSEADATKLAAQVDKKLGETKTTEMTGDVQASAKDAPLALLIGADDANFAGAADAAATDTTSG
jgi:hypothetical protein